MAAVSTDQMSHTIFAMSSSAVDKMCVLALISLLLPFALGAPVVVDLTKFSSGAAGTRFIGSTSETRISGSAVQVGDHNGDGYNDFAIGSAAMCKVIIVMKKSAIYSEIDVGSLRSTW